MKAIHNGASPATATPETVKVWDPLVRLFHWSLAALFAIAFATGEHLERVHILVGYGVLGLIAFRIIWGLVGTRDARFSDFVCSPGAVMAYLRDMIAGRAKRYLAGC